MTHWLDVDWVELGCRGWEIDESGAELTDGGDWDGCHLDRTTLHVIVSGDFAFVRRAMADLSAAWPKRWVPVVTGITGHWNGGSTTMVEMRIA